ncbi:MAG TPA: HNH endonuclease signature motif containing protein [Bryobacteraceae bacterium]|jgi:hypothetical protein|nr:HNH endonuclease signature motif containing protein [Bryobacteraceae bacterium]
MFLHELSRKLTQSWGVRIDGLEYKEIVREWFGSQCPYCSRNLANIDWVVEHLDGMNRYRAGLHVPGNVLVACKKCNGEKRRDDLPKELTLAESGWASFLSHDGTRCPSSCRTCMYWKSVWADESQRHEQMSANLQRIRAFRKIFPDFEMALPALNETLPGLLTKLYSDCQRFAETEIRSLLDRFDEIQTGQTRPHDSESGQKLGSTADSVLATSAGE